MYEDKTVSAVVLAGGNSVRMGMDINKVYCEINDKYIIKYSILAFDINEYVDDIYVVSRKEDIEFLSKKILKFDKNNSSSYLNKPIHVVEGGKLRSNSVYNAIKEVKSDIVIVHDGARPFIRQEYINKCVLSMSFYKGSVVGTKNADNIAVSDDGFAKRVDSKLYQVQTPQCFHTDVLLKSYEKLQNFELATDDSFLLENAGYNVKIIEGFTDNIKITNVHDIAIALSYLKNNEEI